MNVYKKQKMEELPVYFTQNQRLIIQKRIEGHTYTDIEQFMGIHTGMNTTAKHISKCILRSSMGLPWDFAAYKGDYPYLCQEDLDRLKETVREASQNGHSMEVDEVLDEAMHIKTERIMMGIRFLTKLKCPILKEKLAAKSIECPTRQWINGILESLEGVIRNKRLIDSKRLEACSTNVITEFYVKFGNKIASTPPALLFNADETMMESKAKRKVVVPNNVRVVIEAGLPALPHISAMVCSNVFGKGPPPLLLLEGLKNLPPELETFVQAGLVSIGSTSNGFMTRDMFLLWSILFIHWLMNYRLQLPPEIQQEKALLIVDGHTSRECPLALLLLRKAFVEVLILPSHTTHVLQWFDVGLAAILKQAFRTNIKKNLKEVADATSFRSDAAKYRYAVIKSFIDAWTSVLTISNCLSAAKATGFFPCDPEAPKRSVFVRDLTTEEQARVDARNARNARRFTIGSNLVTEANFLVQLDNYVKESPGFAHLCGLERLITKSYKELVQEVLTNPHNNSYLLSAVPPLVIPGRIPFFFTV